MEGVTYYSKHSIAAVLIAPHAVFSIFATIFVGLFIYTRRFVTKVPVAADECVAVVALVKHSPMVIHDERVNPGH